MKKFLFACVVMLAGATCQSALFSGPSGFTTPAASQLGPLTRIIHKRHGGCWRERGISTGGWAGVERRSWG